MGLSELRASSRSKAGDPSIQNTTAQTQSTQPIPASQLAEGPGGRGAFLHAGATTEALRSMEGTQDNALTTLPALWQEASYLQSHLLDVHKLFLEEPRLRKAMWRKGAVEPGPRSSWPRIRIQWISRALMRRENTESPLVASHTDQLDIVGSSVP